MKSINTSKFNFIFELDYSRVLKVLVSVVLVSNKALSAGNEPKSQRYNAEAKTSYFISSRTNAFPSFLSKFKNGDFSAEINTKNESFRFEIKRGLISRAIVEKTFKKFHVTVDFIMLGNNYRIRKIHITNKKVFSSDGDCSDSNIIDISHLSAAIGVDETSDRKFLGDTCSNLRESDIKNLNDLEKVFDSSSHVSNEIVNCLDSRSKQSNEIFEDLKKSAQNSKSIAPLNSDLAKQAMSVILSSFRSRVDMFSKKREPLQIECRRKSDLADKRVAEYDSNTGAIVFLMDEQKDQDGRDVLSEKGHLLNPFIHEFSHLALSKPAACSNLDQEVLATVVAHVCSNEGGEVGKAQCLPGLPCTNVGQVTANTTLMSVVKVSDQTAINITAVEKAIPIQEAPQPSTLNYLNDLPESASSNSASMGALAASFSAPINVFSNAITSISSYIPRAQAEERKRSESSPSKTYEENEEIIVPDSKSQGFIAQDAAQILTGEPKQSFAAFLPQNGDIPDSLPSPVSLSQRRNSQDRAPASNVSNTTTGGGGGNAIPPSNSSGSGYSRQLIQNAKPSAGNSNVTQIYQIGGINFTKNGLSGEAYATYTKKIQQDPIFKSELETKGILISKGGGVVTKPEQVALIFLDTGHSLLFGNLQ